MTVRTLFVRPWNLVKPLALLLILFLALCVAVTSMAGPSVPDVLGLLPPLTTDALHVRAIVEEVCVRFGDGSQQCLDGPGEVDLTQTVQVGLLSGDVELVTLVLRGPVEAETSNGVVYLQVSQVEYTGPATVLAVDSSVELVLESAEANISELVDALEEGGDVVPCTR